MTEMTEIDKDAPTGLILSVPESNFDLLEGTAEVRGRSRIFNAFVFVILLAVAGTLASRGLLTRLDASRDRDEVQKLNAQSDQIRAELAARRRAGEVSGPALREHVEQRLQVVESVTKAELDYARMIREITDLGPGIAVRSIVFQSAGESAPAVPGEPATTTTAKLLPSVEGEPPPSDSKAKEPRVTVSGTAPDTATANLATGTLSDTTRFPYLTTADPGNVNCTGGDTGRGCTWTWNGKINDRGGLGRAAEIRKRTEEAVSAAGGGG